MIAALAAAAFGMNPAEITQIQTEVGQSPSNVCYIFNKHAAAKNLSTRDIYAVYDTVLKTAGLEASFKRDLENYCQGSHDGDIGVRLIKALRGVTTLEEFKAIVAKVRKDINDTYPLSTDAFPNRTGAGTKIPATGRKTGKRDPRAYPAPVTPRPVSPQN